MSAKHAIEMLFIIEDYGRKGYFNQEDKQMKLRTKMKAKNGEAKLVTKKVRVRKKIS